MRDLLQGLHEYRRLDRTGKASSPLDKIRPKSWTVEMTEELFEVLRTIKRSLAMAPELSAILDRIIQSSLFHTSELAEPEELNLIQAEHHSIQRLRHESR
jgi:hypothetical protein